MDQQLQRAPGGTRLNARQVSYDEGSVIVDVGPAAFSDCPGGWVCLFDYTSWGGRMLQFQSSGYTQNLSSYGFDNSAESWVNNKNRTAYLHDGTDGSGYALCLNSNASSSSLGGYNNTAGSIYLANDQTACTG